MDLENQLLRLEETRMERLSLSRALKISHRLKRHLAARGVPFFRAMSSQTFADWSRADAEKLLDLWRALALLNECRAAILVASVGRQSWRTCWTAWKALSVDIDYNIQVLESFGILPKNPFSQLFADQRRHDDDRVNAARPDWGQGTEGGAYGN
jgi:hypothetical protein